MDYWLVYLHELVDCLVFCQEGSFESVVQILLIFEIIFLLSITFLSLGIRLVRDHIRIKKAQFSKQVQVKIEKVLHDQRAVRVPKLNRKQRNPSILVLVLEEYDQYHQSNRWVALKRMIIKTYLMSASQKFIKSKNWKRRNLALRVYHLDLSLFPEEWIINGLDDKLALNQIHAALCVGKLGTRASVNALLNQLTSSGRFGRLAYEDALIQGNPASLKWVRERYLYETNIELRKVCLDILGQKIETGILAGIIEDINHENFELRLAAARALGSQPSEKSIELLSKSTFDESWVVRATSVKSLGRLGDRRALPLLAQSLRDNNWWVRLNSAVALLEFDEVGTRVLKMQDPDVDNYAYEMARYVLALKA